MEMENSRVKWTGRPFNIWIGYQPVRPAVPAEWRKDLFALIRKDRGQQKIMKINRGLMARHLFAGVTSISAGRKKKEI
jgi:hypothetical protein